MATRDPRDRVTPTAFAVAPDLLGVVLATPWRRASAAGFDAVLAVLVAEVGGPAFMGIASAVLFVLVATRRPARTRARRVGRAALVGTGALILFGVVMGVTDEAARDAEDGRETETRVEARARVVPAVDSAAAAQAVQAYAAAFAAGDAAALDTLRGAVVPVVAGPEVARLGRARAQARVLRDENDGLRETVENPGFLRLLWALAADVGLAIGWLGVYVVLTLTLWNGYTPGKRLVGIRVVRLDGRRLSLWTALDRLGGYAAGLVTGLLGFAQVLWDPNRQGVQDKIAGTVVVRTDGRGEPRRVDAVRA